MLARLLNPDKIFADKDRFGRWGEKQTEKFLKRKGLKTLTKNYSCKTGEIDLIMVDTDRSIVFVEVKTRADELFEPAESVITYNKQLKMTKTARYFLATNNITNRPYRFDVVTIVASPNSKKQIRHYENAFIP
ncbi:MAG: YraN family protein [Planctomycetota bacterium]|jgi:putative endonuclease